jgi:hypothetical protein
MLCSIDLSIGYYCHSVEEGFGYCILLSDVFTYAMKKLL